MIDHPFVIWTARLVVTCYLLRYMICAWTGGRAKRLEATVWSAGAVLLAVHVAGAFHFVHDWSHRAAVIHTAERTEEVVGIDWGGGVWLNYLAILVWGVDAALLLRGSPLPRRFSVIWAAFVHSYLALLMLSATVLFGPQDWWIVAAGFAIAVSAAMIRRRRLAHKT